MDISTVIDYINKNTVWNAGEISIAGKGASACVYKVKIDEAPYVIAVKCSDNPELLKQEYDQIKFISDRVDCKLPRLYHFGICSDGTAVMIMEHFNGVSAGNLKHIRKAKKILPDMIVDNLIKIHTVHNDKFGYPDNAVYNTWYDFYSEFAEEIYTFAKESYKNGELTEKGFSAVELSYKSLDKILCDTTGKPTLIHGDYWQPNFIANADTFELIGIIDPFNIMWAEPEYELFTLTVGGSKKLKLYEKYKSKVPASKFCDLKVELYALYNELLWYKKLGTISHEYLLYRSKRLIKQMKRLSLK